MADARCQRTTKSANGIESGLADLPEQSTLPLLDTTDLHAPAAVAFALGE
ncbi:hypothetical protein [Pseudomonas azerbaijanorientalis]